MRHDRVHADARPVNDVQRPSTEGESRAVDAVFDALSDQRRRFVVEYLTDQTGPVGLDELASRIDEKQNGPGGDATDLNSHDRTKGSLYHVHLPKLDDAGIVEFDRTRGTVRPVEDEQRLELCRDLLTQVAD